MLGRPSAFDHIKPIAGWPAHSPSGQLTPPCWPDSKDFLSPSHIGYDISRPSSVTSTHSAPPLAHNIPFKGAYAHNVQLPALSTLASLAAASIPANDRAYQASHPQFSINAPLPLPGATVCASQTGPVSLCNNTHTCQIPDQPLMIHHSPSARTVQQARPRYGAATTPARSSATPAVSSQSSTAGPDP